MNNETDKVTVADVIAAANTVAPVTPQVDALPGVTPLGVTPVEAETTAAPVTDTVDDVEAATVAPADDTVLSDHAKAMAAIASLDELGATLVNVAITASTVDGLATALGGKLPTDKVTKVPPARRPGEKAGKYQKRLDGFYKANPDVTRPVKATPDKPVGDTGNGKPAAKPATPAPVITPAPTVPALTAVKPAKPAKADKPVITPGDNTYGGYDFTDWPQWLTVKPSREAVLAATAVDYNSKRLTKGTLSIACGLEMGSPANDGLLYNVYDLGIGMHTVTGFSTASSKPDQKQVHVAKFVRAGFIRTVQVQAPDRHPLATPGNRPRACDRVYLTAAGLKLVEAAFAGAGLAVPLWLSDPVAARKAMADEALATAVEAENAKAAALAAREAKKLAAARSVKKANA